MAGLAGRNGKVKIGANTVISVTNWSLDISADMLDTSALGDGWKSTIPGLLDASGSVECSYETSDATGQTAMQTAFLESTSIALQLYVDSTHYYSATAYITGMSVETPVDDKVTRSYDIQTSGAVTYS